MVGNEIVDRIEENPSSGQYLTDYCLKRRLRGGKRGRLTFRLQVHYKILTNNSVWAVLLSFLFPEWIFDEKRREKRLPFDSAFENGEEEAGENAFVIFEEETDYANWITGYFGLDCVIGGLNGN